jgi:hypothetical protein
MSTGDRRSSRSRVDIRFFFSLIQSRAAGIHFRVAVVHERVAVIHVRVACILEKPDPAEIIYTATAGVAAGPEPAAAAVEARDLSSGATAGGDASGEDELGLPRGDAEELCAAGIEGYFRNVSAILRPEVRAGSFLRSRHRGISADPLSPRPRSVLLASIAPVAQGYLVLRTCNHSEEEVRALLRSCACGLRLVRNVAEDITSSGVITLLIRKESPTVAPSA